MSKESNRKKKALFPLPLVVISATLITVTGMLFRQNVFRLLPLYVSLVVGLLQSKASRFSYLLGGLNCLIYTVVYVSFGLYASAANTLFVSCPLQLITFIRWSKNRYKHSTKFRSMKAIHWLLVGIGFVVCFVIVNFALSATHSSYRILDNCSSLVSVLVSILSLLSFREFSWLMLLTGVLNLVLYGNMTMDDPAQITYFIYALNSMICIILQFFSVRKIYAEQNQQTREENFYENHLS